MGGDEVDARPGLSPAKVELVGRSAEPRRERLRAGFAAPEVADVIAKPVVPLGPARRKSAHLIAAGTAIPRFGDQLDLGKQRVLPDHFEKTALGAEAVGLARQDRTEIEAESVDPGFAHPVAQAVHHHLDDARMTEVERVSCACVVDVEARLVRQETVVGLVVDALEGKRRTALVALRRMVVDHVQDHFEAAVVETGDHLLELAQRIGNV